MYKKGIDVSGWQGNIDWEEVKNDNVEFVILKLGNIYENDKNDIDSKFERNYNECKRLNIPLGVYVYSYALSTGSGKKGAKHVIDVLKNKKIELPIFIDIEDTKLLKISKEQLTKTIISFCEEIEKAGFKAGIYCNLNWALNRIDKEVLKNYKLWIAQYNDKCQYTGDYLIWQNSSTGKIKGINGNVDTNIMINDNINYNDNKYKINNNYTTQVNLNVRSGAGTDYRIKTYKELTEDGKKHAFKQDNAVLKSGTKVTCLDVIIDKNNNIWIKIPSGYICAYYNGKEYIK